MAVLRAFFVAVPLLTATAHAEVTRLKPDEHIVFYPTIGQRVPGKDAWRLEIQGCVFEPEKGRVSLAVLREALELKDVEMSGNEGAIFRQRARLFLVDHERGKSVYVRVGDQVFRIGRSAANGSFGGTIILPEAQARQLAFGAPDSEPAGGTSSQRRATSEPGAPNAPAGHGLPFNAELPPGDPRRFAGQVLLLEETGVSVVSDIDDTIKITEVRDRRATLRNTFLREFQPVPGLAEFYETLTCSNHATFHYVSASPWQLYAPLAAFVRANGFPAGTFALKQFRWKDRSYASLFASPEQYKPEIIEPLLKRFPKRTFILIGDSGERDPDIYATLARKFPRQVERIYIRDVTGETAEAERYARTFEGLPRRLWTVFRDPPCSN